MSMWPSALKIGPLREWPGALTPDSLRENSSFRAPLSKTLDLLDKETWHLAKTTAEYESAEMLIAVLPGGFRKDGRPRADAKTEHPGIVFSMDTPHGHLSYPSDKYRTWEENLRAVALSLEALRKVNRYGVTRHGEQYRGFLAIESSGRTGVEAALRVITEASGWDGLDDPARRSAAVRLAKRSTHPDTTLDPAMLSKWGAVVDAERVLREAGLL